MAAVIALFDDEQSITRARDELEKAGYGDEVVEVIDKGYASGNAPQAAAPVATTGAQPGGAVFEPGDYPDGLRNSSLSSEEKDFFMQSLGDGTKMIILDADGRRRVATSKALLNKAGANRVHAD